MVAVVILKVVSAIKSFKKANGFAVEINGMTGGVRTNLLSSSWTKT